MKRLCHNCGQRFLHGSPRLFSAHPGMMTSGSKEFEYRNRMRSMAIPKARVCDGQPYVLGLTGSIAMGKSTIASMFADLGVPVMDSDATVHQLYEAGGAGVPAVQKLFPDAIKEGAVDRHVLARHVIGPDNEANMASLEKCIHPLVTEARRNFLSEAAGEGHRVVVLDIPLLFENAMEDVVDAVVVASAPPELQRERALQRPGMTQQKLNGILARQVPDDEKRRRAHIVVSTEKDVNMTRVEVAELVHRILALR